MRERAVTHERPARTIGPRRTSARIVAEGALRELAPAGRPGRRRPRAGVLATIAVSDDCESGAADGWVLG